MEQSFDERTPPTPEERAALRARAEAVRASAHDLILRCVALHEKHEQQRLRHQERLAATASLRCELRGAVVDYALALRKLEVAPEAAVILVKELMEAPARLPTAKLLDLRRDIVGWAIEGYFAA